MKTARVLGFLFFVSLGFTILFARMAVPSTGDAHVRIQIGSGETVQDIAQTLKDHGLIRSATAFRLYLKSKGLDTGIRPGTFLVDRSMSFAEIAEMLTAGEGREAVVTIPEGYTIAEIDALLADMDLITGGDLLDCAKNCDFSSFDFLPSSVSSSSHGRLEGYLFPDTYFVDVADFVPQFFLERLLGTFRTKVINGLSSDLAVSERSLHDVVTMASLIERETRTGEERPMIAGILWKRFDSNRGLDTDATVRYILGKQTGSLTKEDLETDSPYNTRRYRGLPPGPIANPGLASIKAALRPQTSSYWYYLHGRNGEIHYAETNEEHNGNKAKYL